MNVLQKLLLVSLGLAIANFNLSAAERREGESQEDANRRVRDQERKKEAAAKEQLSLGDLFYLKKDGPDAFYASYFRGLTEGKKVTFLETWMQQGIDEQSTSKMSAALYASTSMNIEIDPQIIRKAKTLTQEIMKQGMRFLRTTSSKEEAKDFVTTIDEIRKSNF